MSDTRELLRRHGSAPIASAVLQPGVAFLSASFGQIAYWPTRWGDLTLGGPLADPGDRGELMARFARQRRRPLFYYLDGGDARELARRGLGYSFAGIGVERSIEVEALLRSPPSPLKSARRKADRAGLRLREVDLSRLEPGLRQRLRQINASYLSAAKTPLEIRFLNRPFQLEDGEFCRVFAIEKGEEGPFGVVAINPFFEQRRPRGYLLDIVRFEPTKLWGVYLAVVAELCEILRGEGVATLSLGYCPLHRAGDDGHLPDRWPFRAQVGWMSERFQGVPYLERLRAMKDLLPGDDQQRYMADRARHPHRLFLAFLEASGLPVGEMAALAARRLLGPQKMGGGS